MVARFLEDGFLFEDGQQSPEHIEGYSRLEDLNPTKIRLEVMDSSSDEPYILASNIDDLPTALVLVEARRRRLEVFPEPGITNEQVHVCEPRAL